MAEWYSIEVVCDPTAANAVEHALGEFGAAGISTDELAKRETADISVVGYFSESPATDEFRYFLQCVLEAFDIERDAVTSIAVGKVEQADWLAEWKKYWKPAIVGCFVIAPPWEEIDEPGKIVIRIEPKMAFGTGTHETTQLCLAAIDQYYSEGESFLDVGTGTGILSIAAAKMQKDGTEPAVIRGCDTDEESVQLARENAELNGVSWIDLVEGTIDGSTAEYDFVCANVTLDVITPLLPDLLRVSKNKLILSGILCEQEAAVREALWQHRISDPKIKRAGEWIAVIIDRAA
ncbi:MAG: 50S ribosomal protein L11 methyltransferase [Acidobacteria bacterium]|nr:50S ribosomal protein L11 methyltransferase [Acidobacteriota bacterium]